MREESEFYIANVMMTKRAVLAADFPKEVMVYVRDYTVAELENSGYSGYAVCSDQVPKSLGDLEILVTRSIEQAFNKPYNVRFYDEYGLEASSMEDDITIVIDIDNALNVSIH